MKKKKRSQTQIPAAAPAAPPLKVTIEALELPMRVYRCLKTAGIHTVEQLMRARQADLLKLRNFGVTSLQILKTRLRKMGMSFEPAASSARAEDLTVLLGMPIEQIGFSDALIERLHLAQIERLGELVTKPRAQLIRFPSLGPRSIQMIRSVLNDFGLELGMDYIPVSGEKWMDRLDAAREKLSVELNTPASEYFFARHYGIALKTLRRFLKNDLLTPYESSKLRRIFSARPDFSRPFDMKESESYRKIMKVYEIYEGSSSLQAAARELGMSHEQARQLLKLGSSLDMFTYAPD